MDPKGCTPVHGCGENLKGGNIGSFKPSTTTEEIGFGKNIPVDMVEREMRVSSTENLTEEPVYHDPSEEFHQKEFSDVTEEFMVKEDYIKEEPLDYFPSPIINQELLLPVKILKSEDDSDEQVITPNIT